MSRHHTVSVNGPPERAGYWQAEPLVMALALVRLAHIGLDRLLGMGLKYNDRFTHTHLGDRPDTR